MKSTERSVSVWEATRPQLEFPPLTGTADTDVCVVGAGIAGMSVAYQLARAGQRVVVLDHASVGGGETGQTTAHLTSAMDDYYHVLEKVHGEKGARLIRDSHQSAIEEVGRIAQAEGIDCDYERVDGYWFLAPEKESGLLEKERDAARRCGAEDVELVDRIPGVPFQSGPALRFPGQGQFHPLKYLEGLAGAIQRLGGTIHTGTHVNQVEGGVRPHVAGDGFEVHARAVVVCTNPPISSRVAIHAKQAPYRTFVIGARVPKGSVAHGLYWDTLEPYHYVRLQRGEEGEETEWLIVGGEDHKQGHADDADDRFMRLEAWTKARFPVNEVPLRWSGLVMEPMDFLGYIGREPTGMENVYISTGDSGQGMTHGTIAGMLIRDLVLGTPNPWEELYDPKRKELSKETLKEWGMEALDMASEYTRLAPTGGDVSSEAEIAPGCGAVLQRGLRKIAAYRDEQGVLHERSAICTHLGCVVHWNSLEASWDCPCHGSRFGPRGEVLTGPAPAPLQPVDGE